MPTLQPASDASKALEQPIPSDITLTPVKEWKVFGNPASRPNGRDIVTGAHQVSLGHHPAWNALRQGPPRTLLRR